MFSVRISARATSSGNEIIVHAPNHGLTANTTVAVLSGDIRNTLEQVQQVGNTLVFTTMFDHDLTEPRRINDDRTVTLEGCSPAINGRFNIWRVPNRRQFSIIKPDAVTDINMLDCGVLVERRPAGILGAHVIARVPDQHTFVLTVTGVPVLPREEITNLEILAGLYIFAAADADRALAHYRNQNNDQACLYLIMTDTDVSKDRDTQNDGLGGFTRQNLGRQTLLQGFSTLVVVPTQNSVTGAEAQEIVYGDLYLALTQTLFGFYFPDETRNIEYVAVSAGHGPGVYNSSIYSHVYDWQIPRVVVFENGVDLREDVAFRDIGTNWIINVDGAVELTGQINLDDEPFEA